jgi:hypothetical protein
MTDADGFDLLADDTRAAILRELAEARRESPADPYLAFSELRERVGTEDSGRFNYHLGKLRGHLVAQTDDGYMLSPVGQQAAGAILGGAYSDPEDRGPVELSDYCGRCGEVLEAVYRDGLLHITCENNHGFGDAVPAAAVEDASLAEATVALDAKMRADIEAARSGVCPTCFGGIDWQFESGLPAEAPVDFAHVAICQSCGQQLSLNPGLFVFDHPAVVAAYHEVGVDLRDQPLWTIDCCVPGLGDLVSENPVRVAIDAGPERDQRFVLDETGAVVDAP